MSVFNGYYVLLLIVYISALIFYFINVVYSNRKVNQMAFWLLAVVWTLQGLYLLWKGFLLPGYLFSTQADTLFFYSWLIISFSLLMDRYLKMDLLLFLANCVGLTAVVISLFMAERQFSTTLSKQLASEWILMHISLAFLSYAALTISALLSLLYVLEHFLLKRKLIKHLYRWPGLARLDRFTFFVNMIGYPLLLASLIFGFIWADQALNIRVWQDGKVWFTAAVVIGYTIFFYLRLVRRVQGKGLAEYNLFCFLLLLVNYFWAAQLTQFHQ